MNLKTVTSYIAEYMDEKSVAAANKFSNLTHPVSQTLFLEFHGSENATREQVDIVGQFFFSVRLTSSVVA